MIKKIRLSIDPGTIGSLLIFLGSILLISFAMTGLYLDVVFVGGLVGFWWSVAAFALFPLTLVVVPWYALLAHGSWPPMVMCYGGMTGGALVLAAGMWMKTGACVVTMVSSPAGKCHRASGKTGRKPLEGST